MPRIPLEVVPVFVGNLHSPEHELAELSAYGLVRAADYNSDAMRTILHLLSSAATKDEQLLAISAVRGQNKLLIRRLGELLSSPRQDVSTAALNSIAEIGITAIRANHEQIEGLAAETHDSEQKKLARSLLDIDQATTQ